MWPYLKVNSFNEALQLYFDLNSKLGRFSYKVYGVESISTLLPAKRLPIQSRLYRDWSLISHRIISTHRASIKETVRERS